MSIPIDVRIETIIALLEANEPGVKPALKELYTLRLQYRHAKGPLGEVYEILKKAVKENWWHVKRKCHLSDFWEKGPPFNAVIHELGELACSRDDDPDDPYDIKEMADVLIILFDMANRWGWTQKQLADAISVKLALRLEPKKCK